jgi:hypothetical protein
MDFVFHILEFIWTTIRGLILVGQYTHAMSIYNNKIPYKYFNFLFLNINKMKGHIWNQIWQLATCLTKHKCKSKNQNFNYLIKMNFFFTCWNLFGQLLKV